MSWNKLVILQALRKNVREASLRRERLMGVNQKGRTTRVWLLSSPPSANLSAFCRSTKANYAKETLSKGNIYPYKQTNDSCFNCYKAATKPDSIFILISFQHRSQIVLTKHCFQFFQTHFIETSNAATQIPELTNIEFLRFLFSSRVTKFHDREQLQTATW